VDFGPARPEFTRVIGVHLLVDQQFSYLRLAAPLLYTVRSVLSYAATSTQFCFNYSIGGVTAMPRGLHSRLCHAFLVNYKPVIFYCAPFSAIVDDSDFLDLVSRSCTRVLQVYTCTLCLRKHVASCCMRHLTKQHSDDTSQENITVMVYIIF